MSLYKSQLVAALFALAATRITFAANPPPSTKPATFEFSFLSEVDPHLEDNAGPMGEVYRGKFQLKFASGTDLPTAQDLREVFQRIRWSTSNRPDVVLRISLSSYAPLHNQAIVYYSVLTPQESMDWSPFRVPSNKGPNIVEANTMLLEGLHAIVTTDAQLSPAERKATITSVTTELTKVRAMKQALSAMASSQPSQASALSNRINTLQAENQRLSMALSAKEARRQALQNAIAQTRSQIKLDQQTDPVIEQLRTVVKLRDDEVKHLDAMRRAGVATDSEYAEAQAKLAEARVKLAEREASAGKAGKGELLDRLADEMTMTIVDFTDLQIQLDHVRDELHSLNPSSATTQSLEEILKNGTIPQGKDANNLPPLFGQLEERERSLVHEKVILEIDDVEPVAESH